jgi:hypothetical protein
MLHRGHVFGLGELFLSGYHQVGVTERQATRMLDGHRHDRPGLETTVGRQNEGLCGQVKYERVDEGTDLQTYMTQHRGDERMELQPEELLVRTRSLAERQRCVGRVIAREAAIVIRPMAYPQE